MSKPFEYWIALIAAMLFVVMQHKEKPWYSRTAIAAVSGGVGFSQAPELASYLGRSELLTVMILTAFGYLLLDAIGALIADRDWLKTVIKTRLGGGK